MRARPRNTRRKAVFLSGVLLDLRGGCRLMRRDGCFVHREDPSEGMANLENYRPITCPEEDLNLHTIAGTRP
jgi:hypothetical protein